MTLRILFLSAEVVPFAKAGGLGDVCGSLPKALRRLGHDVRVIMPAYQSVEKTYASGGVKSLPLQIQVPTGAAPTAAGVFHDHLPGSDVPVYFIAEHHLLGRSQIYGYDDDPYRFCFFCRAAIELVTHLGWIPEVIHSHDWHAAPALAWLATSGQRDDRYRHMALIFTIHNLAHQGRTSRNLLPYLGVDTPPLREERTGEVNFMARGIYHAHLISTVSPTYSREIMTPQGGVDLDGLLRFRHFDVHGILNGLDVELWNPATDPNLVRNFGAGSIESRIENKLALQSKLGLPVRKDVPLVAMISRLTLQKGLDITGHVIHLLLNNSAGEAQFVVLGSGGRRYEEMLAHLASYHREKMRTIFTYAGDLAPLIYGGSDLFLMPSLFEPCGLGQMIAMRYGSVPVVRATGGLADTVSDGVTGFTFYSFTADDFWSALQRALFIYRNDPEAWHTLQRQGMSADFSWQKSAYGYQQLYEWAVARIRA